MFSYVFLMYGHGKLDLKFVHGRAEIEVESKKIYPKKVYTSGPKLLRKTVEP